jgi:hypothetical protein
VERRTTRRSQRGFIVTIELILLAAICVIGLIVGMATVRDSALAELGDISEAIGALDSSYHVLGVQNEAGTAAIAGSLFTDAQDHQNTMDIDTGIGDADAEYTFIAGGNENVPAIVNTP